MMALKAPSAGLNSGTPSNRVTRNAAAPQPHRAEAVASSALERLHQSPYRGLRGVGLAVNGNTMVLTGQVRTFFLKQMAQHLLGDISGSWEIKNNLRVA